MSLIVAHAVLRMSGLIAVGAFHDDAVYLALGKVLAAGEGYRSIYAVGEPVHLKYPPGLPLIYAVLWKLGGSLAFVHAATRIVALLVVGACGALLWWIARTAVGLDARWIALWVIGPFLLEGSLQYLNLAISEPYFMLGWAAALVLYYRMRGTDHERRRVGLAFALGVTLAATTLIRTQGVVLIPAVLLGIAVDRLGWRAAAATAGSAVVPPLVWSRLHAAMAARGPISTQPDEAPYTAWIEVRNAGDFVEFLGRSFAVNWTAYWDGFPGYVSDLEATGIALLALFVALSLVGGVLLLRRHAALVLSAAATVGIIMVWPWPQDRFVVSFLPVLGLLIAAAVSRGLAGVRPTLRKSAYATLLLLMLSVTERQVYIRSFAYGRDNPRDVLGFSYSGHFLLANSKFLLTAARGVLQRTSPADRLLVDAPAAIYLYTERRGVAATPAESAIVPSVFEQPGLYLASRIRDDSITVVVLGDVVRQLTLDVAAFYQRCPGILTFEGLEQWWGTALFYRVRRNDECMNKQILGTGN